MLANPKVNFYESFYCIIQNDTHDSFSIARIYWCCQKYFSPFNIHPSSLYQWLQILLLFPILHFAANFENYEDATAFVCCKIKSLLANMVSDAPKDGRWLSVEFNIISINSHRNMAEFFEVCMICTEDIPFQFGFGCSWKCLWLSVCIIDQKPCC